MQLQKCNRKSRFFGAGGLCFFLFVCVLPTFRHQKSLKCLSCLHHKPVSITPFQAIRQTWMRNMAFVIMCSLLALSCVTPVECKSHVRISSTVSHYFHNCSKKVWMAVWPVALSVCATNQISHVPTPSVNAHYHWVMKYMISSTWSSQLKIYRIYSHNLHTSIMLASPT